MIAIRHATSIDCDATVEIWKACDLTRPWNDPVVDFQRAVDHSASTILVAESAARIVGTVMAGFDGHRGWIIIWASHRTNRGAVSPDNCSKRRATGCGSKDARKSN